MGKRYGKVLTIVLVLAIVLIIGILGFFAFRVFNSGATTKKALDKVAEFDKNTETQVEQNNQNTNNTNTSNNTENTENAENSNNNTNNLSLEEIAKMMEEDNNTSGNTNNNSNNNKDTYYEGYKVIGTISIPSINIVYPILEENNSKTLKMAIVAVYPNNPENAVNKPGNLVLWGHNYKDGTFFSDIKKLATGAKIQIKDTSGNKVTYQVYNSYETSDSDMSYARRDTEGTREITLSTCSNASGRRDIVWAREVKQ